MPGPRPEVALMEYLAENTPAIRLDTGAPGWQFEHLNPYA